MNSLRHAMLKAKLVSEAKVKEIEDQKNKNAEQDKPKLSKEQNAV